MGHLVFTCLDFASAHPGPQGSDNLSEDASHWASESSLRHLVRCLKPSRCSSSSLATKDLGAVSHIVF